MEVDVKGVPTFRIFCAIGSEIFAQDKGSDSGQNEYKAQILLNDKQLAFFIG